jgi:hypothetical protein
VEYVFIEYAYNNCVYEFFVHKSSIKDNYSNIIIESMNVILFKHTFYIKSQEIHPLKRMNEVCLSDHRQIIDERLIKK